MNPALLGLFLAVASAAEPLAEHQALYLQARSAESARDYAVAVRACTEAVELLPTGPRAATCRARLDWLAERRDRDGRFVGLEELQAVRADYRELDPEVAADRVRALRERDGLAELVWVDAGVWLARDALERRSDPAAALALTEPIVARHQGALRKPAVGLHAMALAQLGRDREAVAAEAEIRVNQAGDRLTPVEAIVRERLVGRLVGASWGAVALFALVGAPLALRSRTERLRPWGLIPIAVATLGAGLIAERWAEGAGAATPWMFLGFSAVHLVAGPAGRAAQGPMKPVVAVLAGVATAAVATLALVLTGTLAWVVP